MSETIKAETVNSPRNYWIAQCFCWSIFTLGNFIYALLIPQISPIQITVFIILGPLLFLSTHTLRKYYKCYATKWSILKLILNALWSIPILALLVQLSIYIILSTLISFSPQSVSGMTPYTLNNYLLYTANTTSIIFSWSLVYMLVIQYRKQRQRDIAYWQTQAQLRDMELQFLRSQINSHFLFNAMNNVRSLILENQQLARDRLTQLANILRATMQINEQETIPLIEEMALVRSYLDLESLQLEDRLNVDYSIDPQIEKCQLPPLIIQTLVENAIRHGIAQRSDGGTIAIKASLEAPKNGRDMQAKIEITNPLGNQTAKDGHGIGIKNAQQRLDKVYGREAWLELNIVSGVHVATILVPFSDYTQNSDIPAWQAIE